MRHFMYELGLALTLVTIASARMVGAQERDLSTQQEEGFLAFVQRFFKDKQHQKRQVQECVQDSYYTFLSQWPAASSFCSGYISIATQTVITDYTPTS